MRSSPVFRARASTTFERYTRLFSFLFFSVGLRAGGVGAVADTLYLDFPVSSFSTLPPLLSLIPVPLPSHLAPRSPRWYNVPPQTDHTAIENAGSLAAIGIVGAGVAGAAASTAAAAPEEPSAGGGGGDLASALAAALSQRKGNMGESDEEEESDDDW